MILDQLKRSDGDGTSEISARVRGRHGDERRLWFRFPAEFAPDELDGSPFLAGVLIWAMRRRENIALDAPVSPQLLANIEKIIAILHSLAPAHRRRVVVEAPAGQPPRPTSTTGAFFTRGVDSWYAVLKALEDETQEPSLAHLVFCPDFLSDRNSPALMRSKTDATADAVALTGLRFVEVRTNVKRDFGGAQLMSTALALGFQRMLVPSGAMHGEIVRATTHPVLDHRFSTERTEIVHYGDANRLDKVARIVRSQSALDTLRVCHYDGEADENCGRCEKCMRTMLQLHIVGSLERASTLPKELDPLRVAQVRRKLGRRHQWVEILHALTDDPRNRQLAAAVRLVLAHDDLISASNSVRELAADAALRELHPRLPRTVRHASALARSARRLVHPSSPGRLQALRIRALEGVRESAMAYRLRGRSASLLARRVAQPAAEGLPPAPADSGPAAQEGKDNASLDRELERLETAAAATGDRTRLSLLLALRTGAEATLDEMSSFTDSPQDHIRPALLKLTREGLIKSRRSDGGVVYSLTPAGAQASDGLDVSAFHDRG